MLDWLGREDLPGEVTFEQKPRLSEGLSLESIQGKNISEWGNSRWKSPQTETNSLCFHASLRLHPFPSTKVLSPPYCLWIEICFALLTTVLQSSLALFSKEILVRAEQDSHGKHIMLWRFYVYFPFFSPQRFLQNHVCKQYLCLFHLSCFCIM